MTRLNILRPGGLGDSLLLAPALAAIRARQVMETRLIGYPSRLEPLLRAGLCGEVSHLDSWLDQLQRSPQRQIGVDEKVVSFFVIPSHSGSSEIEFHPPFPPEGSGVHVAQHIAACLGTGPLTAGSSPLENLIMEREGVGPPRVWIHPGAGSADKRWPVENFLSLAGRIQKESAHRVNFLFGEADEALAPPIRHAGWEPRFIPQPVELAESWARGDLFVGNDSGVAHLAGLCGLRTFAIFGPSDPRLWSPWGARVEVIREPLRGVWPSVGGVLEVINRSSGLDPGGRGS